MIGITIERNVTSSRRNAIARTNANTYQRSPMSSLKSTDSAVKPPTPTSSPPLTLGNTCGTTTSRSVATAAIDVSSVPVPASGTSSTATSPSGLMSTVIGA